MKEIVKQFCPPILWDSLQKLKRSYLYKNRIISKTWGPGNQDLDVYWDPKMSQILETWGEGNVWHELKFLMAGLHGRVLDIACGTGKNIEDLKIFKNLDVYGCDISDYLIQKAVDRGIPKARLNVCDATKTGYENNFFNHSYSIGSLEHFTERGIIDVISEIYRTTEFFSFHNVPVSISGKDDGWIKTMQSYFNNSAAWWLNKFNSVYSNVTVLDSLWHDDYSCGKWFLCMKDAPNS